MCILSLLFRQVAVDFGKEPWDDDDDDIHSSCFPKKSLRDPNEAGFEGRGVGATAIYYVVRSRYYLKYTFNSI